MSTKRLQNNVKIVTESISEEALLTVSDNTHFNSPNGIINKLRYFVGDSSYRLNELVLIDNELYLINNINGKNYYIIPVAKSEYAERISKYLDVNIENIEIPSFPTIELDVEGEVWV